jgi:hypothetical protein
MTISTNTAPSQKLADAIQSIKAVKKYQRDRQTYGSQRVCLYVDDVDGDWLNQFDEEATSELEE